MAALVWRAHPGLMAEELELPDEVYGFGNWLLWMLATRATDVVDEAFAVGPARPSRHYGTVEGHPVPTPSLVAWLLAAAEFGIAADQLGRRDGRLDERQKVLRTIVSRAVGGEPRLFKDRWLESLAAVCGLGDPELDLLSRCRDDEGYPVDPQALRKAIATTLRAQPIAGPRPSPGGMTVIRSLPRDIVGFTGRQCELDLLMGAVVDKPAASGAVVGIHAIGGMAGIGKTAFAIHAAHLLAPRFPDGQVFLPLHGHTPGHHPVDPADALASLLLMVRVGAQQIPPGLEERTALWRNHLASRRLLLVLDDAVGHDQVRPLLPGDGSSVVLVTSRRHLTALDTQVISLDAMPPDQAAGLLVGLAARPDMVPGDRAVAQIAALCGYLPLAIGMLARQLHHHPAWTSADLAADLATARDRLELMHAENLSVAAAFDLSYQDLDAGQQRLFRHLGLHLGTDIDVYAAAALDGTDVAAARRNLGVLYDQYLLTEPVRGRYRLHDLIREHARSLAAADPPEDQHAAVNRLLDYYVYAAATAEARMARQSRALPSPAALPAPTAAVPDMSDNKRALSWARAERTNLLACLNEVTRTGQDARVVALTAGMAAFFRQDGPWADAATRHATAVQAAQTLGDRLAEAQARYDLGVVLRLSGDYPAAAKALEQALALFRDLGDRQGEANALSSLGNIRYVTGEYGDAAGVLAEALAIFCDLGDQLGQTNALSTQGAVRRQTGDYQGAAEALEEAAALCRRLGISQGEANALNHLGTVRRQTGDYQGAAEALEEAVEIYRDLGDRMGAANGLSFLGAVRQLKGDYQGAADALAEALAKFRELGNRAGQANSLAFLGVVRRETGDYSCASEALGAALPILRDLGDRGGQAEALNEMGTLHRLSGDLSQAAACHQHALELAREIGSSWDEAHALAGLGRCALAAGGSAEAVNGLKQASEIFQRIGAADATSVIAEIDAIANVETSAEQH